MMKSWTDTYGVKWYYEVFEPGNDIFLTGVVTDRSEIVTPTEIEGLPVTGVDGVLWCDDAPNIKSVIIANGIEWIRGSFGYQKKLESVMLPDSLVSIEDWSFCGCPSLQDFTIPSSVIEIGSGSFVGSGWYDRQKDGCVVKDGCLLRYKGRAPKHVVVPKGVRIVAGGIFVGYEKGECEDVESVEFPKSVVRYGGCLHSDDVDPVFSGRFEKLREIVLHGVTGQEHVPWVGFEMLNFDENLDGRIHVKIKGPGHVPAMAFSQLSGGVSAVASVDVGYGIEAIDFAVFSKCQNLRSLKIADSVKTIGFGAFNGCDLRHLNLPDGLERISGFCGCNAIKSIVLPPSLKEIDNAFCGCENLEHLVLQKGIEIIGRRSFCGCRRLNSSVHIPDSVQVIESGAFYDTAIWNTSGDCWRGEGLGLVVLDGWVLGVRGNGDKECPEEIVVPKRCGRIRGIARNLMYDCLYSKMNANDGWREPWKDANTVLTVPGVGQWKCGGERAICVSRYESWYEIKT